MAPPCEFCGHAYTEHRPECRIEIVKRVVDRPVFSWKVCGCLFYVEPVPPPLADAYDASGVPRRW